MSNYIASNKIYYVFEHGALTTGLTDGSFTKQAYKDGVANGAAISVSELSGGLYLVTFTPDADGQWHSDVYETATPGTRYSNSYVVGITTSSQVTNEALSTSITSAKNEVIGSIDVQSLDQIKRLCQAILEEIRR